MKTIFQALMIILLIGTSAIAQESQIEVQVPIDSSGTVTEITPDLERKLGIFPDVKRFLHARIFQVNDTSYVLEVAYRVNGKLARRRSLMSREEVEAFRKDVTHRTQSLDHRVLINQEGRGGLIFGQTLLSLGFYGWAVPLFLDVSDSRGAVATYMLVGAGGFYIPYAITRNIPVNKANQMMSFYGATRGIAYGLILEDLLLRDQDEEPTRSQLAFATFGSIAGSLVGFKAANWLHLNIDQAELIGVTGDFGIGIGFGTAYAMGLYENEKRQRLADANVLAFSGLGLGVGNWLSRREDYTRGDAYVLRAIGILGAHLALPIVDATRTEKEKAYAAVITLGSIAGLGVGNRLLQGQNFSFSEGLIITSGQVAGGLLALGITYLVDTERKFDDLAYFTTSALGSLGGFTLTFRAFSRKSSKMDSALQGMDIKLLPGAIAMAAIGKMGRVGVGHSIPVLTVNLGY